MGNTSHVKKITNRQTILQSQLGNQNISHILSLESTLLFHQFPVSQALKGILVAKS